ncbi:MAG: potassium/proton antiporter, partial [Lentimicrobium sp.]|nr:potassium/proton antiporter [Lentimicrobium sp.]
MNIQIEHILLGLSILFLISILAGKASSRFGVPALLLFLSVGMLAGSDGVGIHFENIQVAHTIGTLALCIILFSGGLDTKLTEIRPIIAQGVILATLGVLLTALFTGLFIWWILGMTIPSAGFGFLTALLLASTMSSTDSASVFSILRSKGLQLKNNLRPMLELESGSNDPMAYVLVITLIEIISLGSAPNYWMAGGLVLLQLGIGAVAGYLMGKLSVLAINRFQIDNASLYPILVFTFCIFIFSLTYFIKGNGFLAVYVAGLVIGNSKFIHKRSSLNFFDGLAWLFQLVMFLSLGLLVNPHELIPIMFPALIISLSMIFITRPLSVFICLLPFRKMPFKDKTYISWVGLRGAVP